MCSLMMRDATSRSLMLLYDEVRARNSNAASSLREYCAITRPTAWPIICRVRSASWSWSSCRDSPNATAVIRLHG